MCADLVSIAPSTSTVTLYSTTLCVYLALRIAHNAKYLHLVLLVSCGREHTGSSCSTARLID